MSIAVVALVVVGLVLLALVLAQRGRGAGLVIGGGSGHTVLGVKATEVLTWVTAATFGVFLALAAMLNYMIG